jgi:predicted solute-binding protein
VKPRKLTLGLLHNPDKDDSDRDQSEEDDQLLSGDEAIEQEMSEEQS